MTDLLDGRYELAEPLGSGGTGAVRRARDRVLGREVAVKLLHPGAVGDDLHRTRLREEARLAGSLQHHGIARIFDYGEDSAATPPTPYVVMELVEGRSLAAVLRERGTLPASEVRDLLVQVAAALEVAHAAGIVHRDLKPGNVVLTPAGRAVLVDFGIARSTGGEPLTATGMVIGTVDYLSPERAAGGSAGPPADLYALGVVAHECLTGERAFRRESPVATALAQVHDLPPPLPADVPADLADLVGRLMAKDPGDRPDAAGVVAALGATGDVRRSVGAPPSAALAAAAVPVAAGSTETLAIQPGEPRVAWTPTRRRWAALGAVAVLLLAVVGVAGLLGRPGDPAPAAAGAAGAQDSPVTDPRLRVPAGLVGLPYDEAASRVRDVGLRPVREEWAAGAADPSVRGLVADVQPGPDAGPLAPGSEVVLVVAVSPGPADRTGGTGSVGAGDSESGQPTGGGPEGEGRPGRAEDKAAEKAEEARERAEEKAEEKAEERAERRAEKAEKPGKGPDGGKGGPGRGRGRGGR